MDINVPSQIVVKTAADWASDNTIYSSKRILVTSNAYYGTTDQRKYKIADGVKTWSNLAYFPISGYDDATSSIQTQIDSINSAVPLGDVTSILNTPPGSPADTDAYLVGTSPTGAWATKSNQRAQWDAGGSTWVYEVPVTNNTIYIISTTDTVRYDGDSWESFQGTALLMGGNTGAGTYTFGSKTTGVPMQMLVGNGVKRKVGVLRDWHLNPLLIGDNVNVDDTAMLELKSTTKGFLMTRMTTTQRDAISSPATSLMIYNTTTAQFEYYTGATWTSVAPTVTPGWGLNGNTVTTEKWIGTIDNYDLPFRTNNTEVSRFTTAGALVMALDGASIDFYGGAKIKKVSGGYLTLFQDNGGHIYFDNYANNYHILSVNDNKIVSVGHYYDGNETFAVKGNGNTYLQKWFASSGGLRATLSDSGNLFISGTISNTDSFSLNTGTPANNQIGGNIQLNRSDGDTYISTIGAGFSLHLGTDLGDNILLKSGGNSYFEGLVVDGSDVGTVDSNGRRLISSGDLDVMFWKDTGISLPYTPIGNTGLSTGDVYMDTASNILSNGDLVMAIKQ